MITMVFDSRLKDFIEQIHVGKFSRLLSDRLDSLIGQQLSTTPVDRINHLPIYDIEINDIGNNQIDAHYLLIEGRFLQRKYSQYSFDI